MNEGGAEELAEGEENRGIYVRVESCGKERQEINLYVIMSNR